jgi:hypothetical protein
MPIFNILKPAQTFQGLAGKFQNALTGVAAQGMNQLPDRFNLFMRYITGVGNRDLQLDRSTERSLIRATEKPPTYEKQVPVWEDERAALRGDPFKLENVKSPAQGPGIPTSGPVNPYNQFADKDVTNTLGRFNAEVTPTTVRVTDTYDMVNEAEDPDLVSGKFQPDKAFNLLKSTFIPGYSFNRETGAIRDNREFLPPDKQGLKGIIDQLQYKGQSGTFNPMSDVARSLMYALPMKFSPYQIDLTFKR